MSLDTVGQRCVSEREPELGLGIVAEIDRARVTVEFPATRERRIYARGTPVLKRVRFGVGETVAARDGSAFAIEEVVEEGTRFSLFSAFAASRRGIGRGSVRR